MDRVTENSLGRSEPGRFAVPVLRVEAVDVWDEAVVREFSEVERSAQSADRVRPMLRDYGALRESAQDAGPYRSRTLLVVRDGLRIVGTADLGRSLQSNLHLADIEIDVLPRWRRRGIGTALYKEAVRLAGADRRTTLLGHVHIPEDGGCSPAFAFASALGFKEVHREHHLVLDLPLSRTKLTELPESAPGYDIVTWNRRVPDGLVEAYAVMLTQMAHDVPIGDIDRAPETYDVDRVRLEEELDDGSWFPIVAAARRSADGVLGGYSIVYLPANETHVVQDDTLVMPEHRGHRLGLALKAATLRRVQREHPERRLIHTWNDIDNEAMLRTNLACGFRRIEIHLEMQRRVGEAERAKGD